MVYAFTNLSIVPGAIQVGDIVSLTFDNSKDILVVHEVKIINMNNSGNDQVNSGSSQSGSVRASGTPIPDVNGLVVGGGRSNSSGGSARGNNNGRGVGSSH